MNRLKPHKQAAVISALVEGNSIRSVERMTGIHRDTIMRLGLRIGGVCETVMDATMRNLSCKRIEADEIWCYVGKKQRHILEGDDESQAGDFWTWVAIDAETKLVPAYHVGKRTGADAHAFICDLSSRLTNRIQLSTDGLSSYIEAVEAGFGGDIDYGQIIKAYEAEPIGAGRYSPPKVTSVKKSAVVGLPDEDYISTSYVERQNLTMRMAMRRFTRLTNGFSKKAENLKAAVALHFCHYNFVRGHSSLNGSTPAMAAGVTDRFWSVEDLVALANRT